jgi:hypothetical protein
MTAEASITKLIAAIGNSYRLYPYFSHPTDAAGNGSPARQDMRLNRLDRWEEQLAAHGANVCDCEEPCPPCARCHHAFCRHQGDGWLARDCLSAGCPCRLWLADTDCQYCDGQGGSCTWCHGTGLRYDR